MIGREQEVSPSFIFRNNGSKCTYENMYLLDRSKFFIFFFYFSLQESDSQYEVALTQHSLSTLTYNSM